MGLRSYTFTYDGLSRLKTAAYSGQESESYGIPNINYDRNGNITQLQRNGKTGGSFGLMDNLTYTYSGNRLTAVNDAVSGSYEVDFVKRGSGGYTYYANGALKTDENEEITNIVYNTYLNLPEEITLTGGRWIKYTYDGAGKLLKTEYSTGEYWEYVDEFVFKNGQPYQVAIPDGRATYESGNWTKEFDYKDHLGNTRVSFREGSNGVVQTAKTDLDPWGVRLNGTGVVNPFQNRWELQGHEKESTFSLNRINFGARVYNPTIGRWDRVDPLADHPNQLAISPYTYSNSDPVNMKDDDGKLANPIIGAIIGAGVDYGFQVVGNLARGMSLGQAMTSNIDRNSIMISAGAGALSSGFSAFGGRATQLAVSTGIDVTESVLKQANEGQSITLSQTASDVVSNKVGGALTRNAGNVVDTKVLSREADRTARVSAKDPSSSGRAARAETAKAVLIKAETTNQVIGTAASGVAGNAIQNTSNASRAQSTSNRNYSAPSNTAQSDATRVYKPLILERQ